jgi:hypothetical protein
LTKGTACPKLLLTLPLIVWARDSCERDSKTRAKKKRIFILVGLSVRFSLSHKDRITLEVFLSKSNPFCNFTAYLEKISEKYLENDCSR